jgi:hypothetical protein
MQASSIKQPAPANIFDKVIPLIASPKINGLQRRPATNGREKAMAKCALAAK